MVTHVQHYAACRADYPLFGIFLVLSVHAGKPFLHRFQWWRGWGCDIGGGGGCLLLQINSVKRSAHFAGNIFSY